MSKDIRVQLVFHNQSRGRGIGVYGENLQKELKKIKGIKIVDSNPDLIHYTFYDIFYPTLKINPKIPCVVTVHDVTPLVMSDRYPKGIITTIGLVRQWFQLKKASAVITDSVCSKKDITKYLWIDESKVFVTLLAANSLYNNQVTETEKKRIKEKFSLPEKFVLTVAAGPNPNKNLPNLAEATERLGIPLVIVGSGINQKIVKPVEPELIDLVRLEVYPHLIRLDNVPNEELLILLKLASCYAQASYYEGFGIPLLEAMMANCPIVSSKTSSLPEVYPEGTITFNPKNISSIEKGIKKVLQLKGSVLKKYLEKNKKRSEEFSWKKTALATKEVYLSVL